jgi:hypothetical protein
MDIFNRTFFYWPLDSGLWPLNRFAGSGEKPVLWHTGKITRREKRDQTVVNSLIFVGCNKVFYCFRTLFHLRK